VPHICWPSSPDGQSHTHAPTPTRHPPPPPNGAAPTKTDDDRKRDIWRVLRLGMGSTAGWEYTELEQMYADPDERAWVKFAEGKLM
jgi:hypothetical protein